MFAFGEESLIGDCITEQEVFFDEDQEERVAACSCCQTRTTYSLL